LHRAQPPGRQLGHLAFHAADQISLLVHPRPPIDQPLVLALGLQGEDVAGIPVYGALAQQREIVILAGDGARSIAACGGFDLVFQEAAHDALAARAAAAAQNAELLGRGWDEAGLGPDFRGRLLLVLAEDLKLAGEYVRAVALAVLACRLLHAGDDRLQIGSGACRWRRWPLDGMGRSRICRSARRWG